jgi:hypothetical protein
MRIVEMVSKSGFVFADKEAYRGYRGYRGCCVRGVGRSVLVRAAAPNVRLVLFWVWPGPDREDPASRSRQFSDGMWNMLVD